MPFIPRLESLGFSGIAYKREPEDRGKKRVKSISCILLKNGIENAGSNSA
jgi:hypothetical protein